MEQEVFWKSGVVKEFGTRAVTLDFYGTVVEEDDVQLMEIQHKIADASPLEVTPRDVASYMKSTFRQLCLESYGERFQLQKDLEIASFELVVERFQADLDPASLCEPLFHYWARPKMFPESREALSKCDLPICLVSNIDNAELESALSHIGLSFDRIVTSEDCRAYKPRPEIFKTALSILARPPHEVLHVGDSYVSDVKVAKSLGMPALWINRTGRDRPLQGEGPDYETSDLTGLPRILYLPIQDRKK